MSNSISDVVSERIRESKAALPVFSRTAERLHEIVSSASYDVAEVEGLIGNDPVLSASLLRMANSSFYSSMEKTTTVRDAVVRLGMKQVVNLATLVSQRASFRLQVERLQPLVESLWQHSVACAAAAQWLAEGSGHRAISSEAFMAGMLHDLGKLVVLRVLDEGIHSKQGPDPSDEEIRATMTLLHEACGGDLIEAWNLPESLARVARGHHGPPPDAPEPLVAVVRLVDSGCARLGIGLEPPVDLDLEGSVEARCLGLSGADIEALEAKLEEAKELANSL